MALYALGGKAYVKREGFSRKVQRVLSISNDHVQVLGEKDVYFNNLFIKNYKLAGQSKEGSLGGAAECQNIHELCCVHV